jgi:hypothetical protein
LDVAATVLREAWDFNESTEWLSGALAGLDRRMWRGLAVRGEAVALRVAQQGDDAWLVGFTVGTRVRWNHAGLRPLIDLAVGLSDATTAVPPRGTAFNYLATLGAGVEMPARGALVSVTGRWLHASNAGREGNHRNPDIQSLGVVFGIGWEF